jgi:hypothetical protein
MKRILTTICLLTVTPAYADVSSSLNLGLPSAPMNYQSDKFRAGDLDCSNAIGSATQLEFGVTGLIAKTDPHGLGSGSQVGDIGVYSRIVIPLGKRVKQRINCNRLYELELRKKQLEVMKLEQELKQLRKLQFEE